MGHKILLADDSITVQKIVKLTFSDEGVEVIAVGNGELALQQLMDWQPDLIMADVFMPGRDGYEVCEYVKTNPDLRHIPVLLLVHAFEPFDQARAALVKADCHLTKPFHSIRTLVTTVRQLIEKTSVNLPSAPAIAMTETSATEAPASPAFSPTADPTFSAELSVSEAKQEFRQEAAAHPPLSFETTPLVMSAHSTSGFGEVMALRSQSEPEKNDISFAGLQAPSVQESPGIRMTQPLTPANDAESGQLLSFGMLDNFSQSHGQEAAAPEVLPEPEGLTLIPETAPPVAPESFSNAVMDFSAPATEPWSEPVAPPVQIAESVSFAPLIADGTVSPFSASQATSDMVPGEVLDLDEFLPPTASSQAGEVDLFAEPPLPPMNVFEAEPMLPVFGAMTAEPLAGNSDVLPILADVADRHSGATPSASAETVGSDVAAHNFTERESSSSFPVAQPSLPPPAVLLSEPAFEDVSFPLSSFADAHSTAEPQAFEMPPVSQASQAPAETVASNFGAGFTSGSAEPVFPDFSFEKTAPDDPTVDHSAPVFPTEAHNFEFGQSRDFGAGQVLAESPADHSDLSIEQTALFADGPEPVPMSEVTTETSLSHPLTAPGTAASLIAPAIATPTTVATTSEVHDEPGEQQDHGVGFAAHNLTGSELTTHSIPPALIDEIVNRVVARLSEKAIQEIAWEVVPEMAELIIRKQLAEKSH